MNQSNFPCFVCALCGKNFPNEQSIFLHIAGNPHNAVVYMKENTTCAISYSEYIKSLSIDAEEIKDD